MAKKTTTTSRFEMILPVCPVPASRPRVTRVGHVYYGKKYTQFRTEAAAVLGKTVFPDTLPLGGPLHLDVTFYCPSPKRTNRWAPRGDIDNYLKTLDVLNKVVWFDDDQIVSLEARKAYAEEPRIELEVIEFGDIQGARSLP